VTFRVKVKPKWPERLTSDAAAEYCGIGMSTFEKLRCYGGGPAYYKLGRRVVYDRTDLDAWIAQNKRLSTKEAAE